MNLDILKREIADSLKNNKVYIIKDVFNNTPNWDNFVNFRKKIAHRYEELLFKPLDF